MRLGVLILISFLTFSLVGCLGVNVGNSEISEHTLHPGDLDPQFGKGGKLLSEIDTFKMEGGISRGSAVFVQPDEKILVGASDLEYQFVIYRFLTDGRLDESFGVGGKVRVGFAGGCSILNTLGMFPDGRIIAAGQACRNAAFAILNPNGSPDVRLNGNGKWVSTFEGAISSVHAFPDGRLLLAGGTKDQSWDFLAFQLLADGTYDPSFGTLGKVRIDLGFDEDSFALDVTDNQILIGGYSRVDWRQDALFEHPYQVGLVQLTRAGSLDPSFGMGGKLRLPIGTHENVIRSAKYLSDGKILIAGHGETPGRQEDFFVSRLNANGSVDAEFAKTRSDPIFLKLEGEYLLGGMDIQADGKIVLGGIKKASEYIAVRLNSDGTFDLGYGISGIAKYSFFEDQTQTVRNLKEAGMALDSKGRALIAGTLQVESPESIYGVNMFGLMRLVP